MWKIWLKEQLRIKRAKELATMAAEDEWMHEVGLGLIYAVPW